MKAILFFLLLPTLLNAQTEFKPILSFKHPGSVDCIAFSPDGDLLATGSQDSKARVFSLKKGLETRTFKHEGFVLSVAFSPDGNFMATGCSDHKARIIDLNKSVLQISFQHEGWVNSVAFSPDGAFLATGSADGKARVFEIKTGREVRFFGLGELAVTAVAFSPDGKFLAVASFDNVIRLCSLQNDRETQILHLSSYRVNSLAYSPDGNFLASGAQDNSARIFDLKKGLETQSFGHHGIVNSVSFNPDGKSLASGAKDNLARIFSGLELLFFLHPGSVNSVAFSPNGEFLATGCSDSVARIFSTDNYCNEANILLLRLNEPFSSVELEHLRGKEVENFQNLKKDEFETQAEFEKRKIDASSKVVSIQNEYEERISQAKQVYEINRRTVRIEFNAKLAETLQNVEYPFHLGMYDPENNNFPLSIPRISEDFTIKVPREIAREFKAQSSALKASGQKQLNERIQWDYFNFKITMQNGRSFLFGEQRGASASMISAESSQPPALTAKVIFREPSGNNALDAGEKGQLNFIVTNSGKGSAFGVEAKLASAPIAGINSSPSVFIGEIPPGQTKSVVIDLITDLQLLTGGKKQFTFSFTESRGFPPDPIIITLDAHAFVPPKLIVADVGVSEPSGNGRIENEELVEVKARIQNLGQGIAKDVKGNFSLGPNVFRAQDSDPEFIHGDLAPGAYFDAVVKVYTNKIATDLPIFISVFEGNGKSDIKDTRLDPEKLALNVEVQKLQEVTFSGQDDSRTNFAVAGGLSIDVEQNLPKAAKMNPNAVALIIGIRDYASDNIPSVTYAKRDAQLMRDYLVNVFGYDPKNILPLNPNELMTVGNMKNLMRQKLPAFIKPDGSSEVFVYYTGHGAPSTTSQQPFFVPYDCDPNFVSDDNAYKMLDFYSDVQKLKAKKKIVVIDACFSGETGDGKNLIKNASSVTLKINNPLLADKNAVVFQSSEASQVSNWYPEMKHSMFTYFFLKGLKGEADINQDGKITVVELEKYVNDDNSRLPYVSRREFQRPQRAVVNGELESIILERNK